jgi:hypothetical protein
MTDMEIRHLARDVMTALELAITAHAPWTIVERLATASGLLGALSELPGHTLIPETMDRSRTALAVWREWSNTHTKVIA